MSITLGEYLVFLSKTTTLNICPNKLEQEAPTPRRIEG
ncbi:hypothetical protein MPR_2122 [Myroides profundi]|nr:hypothetical protein MPR_2122 [Myroides profundi]